MDCEQFSDEKRTFYSTLLQRVMKLPWEAKAKYHRLCALLPHLGTDMVRIQESPPSQNPSSLSGTQIVHVCAAELSFVSIRCWTDTPSCPVISCSVYQPTTCRRVHQSCTGVWSSSRGESSVKDPRSLPPSLRRICPDTGRGVGSRSFTRL